VHLSGLCTDRGVSPLSAIAVVIECEFYIGDGVSVPWLTSLSISRRGAGRRGVSGLGAGSTVTASELWCRDVMCRAGRRRLVGSGGL